MTSSKFLKGGLGKGFAFPIMLAAVGLLLASLVLGLNTNFVRALGDGNTGICGYSDDMREAILANTGNAEKPELCDTEFDGTADSAFWGGSDDDDKPKDLDLTGVSAFAPLKGELDGFEPGSRVDLRGTGLTVADLDVSAATGTEEDAADGAGIANQFGPTIGVGNGSSTGTTTSPTGLGLTFLLDGGSETANGFVSETYEGVEGGIAWISFQYSAKPGEFTDFNDDGDADGSVWARVRLTIETIADSRDDGATPPGPASETIDLVINSKDAAGTIYAVPYRIRDNAVNRDGDTEDLDISAALVDVGTFTDVTDGTLNIETTDRFDTDVFNKSIRDARRAELVATDEDAPAVYVSDRQRFVADEIEDVVGLNARKIGIDQLAGIDDPDGGTDNLLTTLDLNGFDEDASAALDDEDKLSSIAPEDLSGLTGLTAAVGTVALDLSRNKLTELPSGLFADVGKSSDGDLSTLISLTGNDGPEGEGFTLANIGAVGDELIAGQVLRVDLDGDSDDRVGIINESLEGTEGGVLVFDVNIRQEDVDAAAVWIHFESLNDDSGSEADDKRPANIDLSAFADAATDIGNYRIAVKLPTNDDDADKTWTAIYGYDAGITTLKGVTPVTIRDASYEAPEDAPDVSESSFESVVVTQNEYVEDPTGQNENLKHNISNFTVTIGGNAVNANFLDVYNATGGSERWGLPTSEVVEIPGIGLTQFFQRGALHLESNAEVKRLLTWDYVGGGLGGSVDQQFEPAPETAPEGGEQIGAFGHYVANVDADGNATGFLDFFNRLGGVAAFGFPKTEARADTGAEGTLMEPGTTAGFTRQYFQAAVFQLAEDGSVQLTLLGDTLRDSLVPGHAEIGAFNAADPLSVGGEVSPRVIAS